jgi:hypothetical protein
MPIDFDAIKRKLEKLQGNSRSQSTMWKPTEGEEATVRLLSFPDNDGQPFKELMFYYNIPGQRGLLAPYQFGKKDPIQELITKLRDDGTKESYELAKKLYPKMRCYAAVIVRGEEDKGVQLWGFGKTVYQKLLGIMLDEDYGDITDPREGRDVKVICTKSPGQQWATTEVMPRGKATPLSKDKSDIKEWSGSIPNVLDIFSCKSYDELSKIVNDWLAGDDEKEEEEWGTSGNKTETVNPTSQFGKSTQKSYSNIDDAFADLID